MSPFLSLRSSPRKRKAHSRTTRSLTSNSILSTPTAPSQFSVSAGFHRLNFRPTSLMVQKKAPDTNMVEEYVEDITLQNPQLLHPLSVDCFMDSIWENPTSSFLLSKGMTNIHAAKAVLELKQKLYSDEVKRYGVKIDELQETLLYQEDRASTALQALQAAQAEYRDASEILESVKKSLDDSSQGQKDAQDKKETSEILIKATRVLLDHRSGIEDGYLSSTSVPDICTLVGITTYEDISKLRTMDVLKILCILDVGGYAKHPFFQGLWAVQSNYSQEDWFDIYGTIPQIKTGRKSNESVKGLQRRLADYLGLSPKANNYDENSHESLEGEEAADDLEIPTVLAIPTNKLQTRDEPLVEGESQSKLTDEQIQAQIDELGRELKRRKTEHNA